MRPRRYSDRDEEVIRWLLEDDNPAVKFLTLTKLKGMKETDPRAREARKAIPEWDPIKRILDKQHSDGGWDEGRNWYLPKYKSSVWQLIALSQTGVDPNVPKIGRMCEYAFGFQNEDGAFISGMDPEAQRDWARDAGCLNGNVIASLSRLGWAKDKRVARAVDHLIGIQEPDGGWTCRTFGYHVRDKHSCFRGAICALEGLVEFSGGGGRMRTNEPIQNACEFVLMHKILRADHHNWRIINPSWAQLHSPWMVGYSIIRALRVLNLAGVTDDPRMGEAIEILESKRRRTGRWRREVSWPSKSYGSFGRAGMEDKWITLNAMLVLRSTSVHG